MTLAYPMAAEQMKTNKHTTITSSTPATTIMTSRGRVRGLHTPDIHNLPLLTLMKKANVWPLERLAKLDMESLPAGLAQIQGKILGVVWAEYLIVEARGLERLSIIDNFIKNELCYIINKEGEPRPSELLHSLMWHKELQLLVLRELKRTQAKLGFMGSAMGMMTHLAGKFH